MKNKITNKKKVEKRILMTALVMGLVFAKNVKVNAAEINAIVQENIEAGAIGTPVEDTVVNDTEEFYDEDDFEEDKEKDENVGQKIDPNLVETEAKRKGVKIDEPTPTVTPEVTPVPTESVTPNETPVEVEYTEEKGEALPKTGLTLVDDFNDYKDYILFIEASLIGLGYTAYKFAESLQRK